MGGVGDTSDKELVVPENGFDFVPKYAHIRAGKTAALTLRAVIPDVVANGSLITIESDSTEVVILTPQVVIQQREDCPTIGETRVEIEGRQVGSLAIVTARLEGVSDGPKAEASVMVISKKEHKPSPDDEKNKGGLIKAFQFDSTAEPRQRVWFERATSNIIIATKAPSVATYFDEEGVGAEQPQGQVMLAELITEATCREIARRGVETGEYLVPSGQGMADAIQREYINLQNKYAHRIHACFVDSTYRRTNDNVQRKGAPTRNERLSQVVTPV